MSSRSWLKIIAITSFLILSVLPVAYMYVSSFNLSRYTWIFEDVRQQHMFETTMILGLGTALLCILLGVSIAVLLEYTDIPFKSCLSVLVIVSLLIPPYIMGISFLSFIGKNWVTSEIKEPNPEVASMVRRDRGITNSAMNAAALQNTLLNKTAVTMPPVQQKPWYIPYNIDPYNVQWAIVILSLALFPIVFLLTSFALRNIDERMIDAALLLRKPLGAIWRVSLPMVLPQILVGGLIVYIFAISELGVPSVMRVDTTTMEVFNHFTGFFDISQALALTVPLAFSIAVLILAAQLIIGKKPFFTVPSAAEGRVILKLGKAQKALGLGYIFAVIAVSSAMPLGILLYNSGLAVLPALEKAGDSILNSLFLSIFCSTLILVPSFFIAYFYKGVKWMDYLILAPLIAPSAALGIGMIGVWNNGYTAFVYGSFLVLAFGYLARFLPFTIKTLEPFMAQVPASVEESGRLAGASFTKTVSGILAPLLKPGLLTAWLIAFILCMRELDLSVMLTPPGFQTLPNRIFTLYHYGDIRTSSVLSLFLVAIVVVPYIAIVFMSNASKWHTSNSKK